MLFILAFISNMETAYFSSDTYIFDTSVHSCETCETFVFGQFNY